jgi:hypothetical protein
VLVFLCHETAMYIEKQTQPGDTIMLILIPQETPGSTSNLHRAVNLLADGQLESHDIPNVSHSGTSLVRLQFLLVLSNFHLVQTAMVGAVSLLMLACLR